MNEQWEVLNPFGHRRSLAVALKWGMDGEREVDVSMFYYIVGVPKGGVGHGFFQSYTRLEGMYVAWKVCFLP